MNFAEGFLRENVFIDFGCEVLYGSGQEYVNYPIRFGTVEFELMASEGLVQIADRIRAEKGYQPMHAIDGWYDFYVGISSHRHGRTDNCIEFCVVNADSEDDGQYYSIDLM